MRAPGPWDSFYKSAARWRVGRRGADFTPEHAAVYRAVFARTAAERQRVLRDAEPRPLRRSA